MKSFNEHLSQVDESAGKIISITAVSTILLRIKSIENQIKSTDDLSNQNKLLSEQMKLNSYLTAFQLALSSKDRVLLQKLNRSFKSK